LQAQCNDDQRAEAAQQIEVRRLKSMQHSALWPEIRLCGGEIHGRLQRDISTPPHEILALSLH
jgi:hypothetical protein